jgi:assimilatory nitrate reductase catalytic subunit
LLFLSSGPVEAARDWLAASLSSEPDKIRLLAGRPGADMPDQGAIVCVCEQVGINTIAASIHHGAASVDAIGEACRAGTNCGSCRSELAAMLSSAAMKAAAE